MMANEEGLAVFAEELLQRTLAEAVTLEESPESRLAAYAVDAIGAVEELDVEPCRYEQQGMQLQAYGMTDDPSSDTCSIDLVVTDFHNRSGIATLTKAEAETLARRCRRVLAEALDGFHERLDESTPLYATAEEIYQHRTRIREARVFVISNRRATGGTSLGSEHVGRTRVRVTHQLWDLERLHQLAIGLRGRSLVEVDFVREFGGGLEYLSTERHIGDYTAYLAIIPGRTLARVYDRWGQRLLEANVRAFLQVKGAVNRGIGQTLREEPGRFLAYNNGISATADAVEVVNDGAGRRIGRVTNLQIVNGGQTTASLYEAYRRGSSLNDVFVQMKLTVLRDPSLIDEVVPLISRFANSQTKVNLSDFGANSPYHRALEALSRSTYTPTHGAGGATATLWYYERMRGQYQDELGRKSTQGERNEFKRRHPPKQKLTKTDVARLEMCWMRRPHDVSRGAQKNFGLFSEWLDEEKAAGREIQVDEAYFKALVAKAILWAECDQVVRRLKQGGYKANVNAYTLAWLSYLRGDELDLDGIWRAQAVPDGVRDDMTVLASVIFEHITDPGRPVQNVTEWCKRPACWEGLKGRSSPLAARVREVGAQVSAVEPRARGDAPGGQAGRDYVDIHRVSASTWLELLRWARRTRLLGHNDQRRLEVLAELAGSGADVTGSLARRATALYLRAVERGFSPGRDVA